MISKTFEEYAVLEVVPKVQTYSCTYTRTDIVFDVYWSSSLKAETRSKRCIGAKRRVTDKGKIPQNWCSFLRDNSNKTELFNFLANKIVKMCSNNTVIVTQEAGVFCNQPISLAITKKLTHECSWIQNTLQRWSKYSWEVCSHYVWKV